MFRSLHVIRVLPALFILSLPLVVRAEDDVARKEEKVVQDPLTIRALARLETRMGIKFNIPFPANFDTDAYRKRPLALISINGSKVCATRPIVNPYDEPRTVEWMLGPSKTAKLPAEGVDCSFDLDERGGFSRFNLIVDWASDGTGNHQISRRAGEAGPEFSERAFLTYRIRAKNAKDPAQAQLFLAAFEKMAGTIHALRSEEARAVK